MTHSRQMADAAYNKYVNDLSTGRYCQGPDDVDCIVKDGERVRVSVTAMDACQCAVAESRPNSQPVVDSPQQNAEKVRAWADHFSDIRKQDESADRADNAAYVEYRNRIHTC